MCSNLSCDYVQYSTYGCICNLVEVEMRRVTVEYIITEYDFACSEFSYAVDCMVRYNFKNFYVTLYVRDKDSFDVKGTMFMGRGDALRSGLPIVVKKRDRYF